MADKYAIDSHKLHFHPRAVVDVVEADTWESAKDVYPIYIEVSPVGACNHRCSFCAVDYIGYKSTMLDAEVFRRRIAEMSTLGVKSVMFAGEGEPLLHKKITSMVDACWDNEVDCAFTTNLTVLPKNFAKVSLAKISWIKASINGGDSETYERIHSAKKGDFEKVLSNINILCEARSRENASCTLGAQLVLLPDNADSVETLIHRLKNDTDLDYLVIKPYSQHRSSHTKRYKSVEYRDHESLSTSLERFSTDDFKVIVRANTMRKYDSNDRYDRCYATPMLWGYVMSDGSVYGCSAYLLNDKFKYGNWNESSFQEIWTGERRKASYHHVCNELNIDDCRKNCRMDEVNRYLHKIINSSVVHKNFI